MTIPDHLQTNLQWIVNLLKPWLSLPSYEMGGGSVLAARWQHRHSSDIDLFIDARKFENLFAEDQWSEICEELRRIASTGKISKLVLRLTGFCFETLTGPISLYSVPRLFPDAISTDQEDKTGIYFETTKEIVVKKIRGRMVNSTNYVARDLYDIVVCYKRDRRSLDEAMSYLVQLERDSLRYDVQKRDATVNDLDRVLNPRFPELVADFDRFNRIAGEVLTQSVSANTEDFLTQIGMGRSE